jgi:hypothetical protein
MPRAERRASPWVLAAAGLLLIAALVGLAAVLNLGPFSAETLTERQFIARADAICQDAHDRYRAVQEDQPQTAIQAQTQAERLIAIAEEELAAVEDLNEPYSLSDSVSRYLHTRDQGIELLRRGLEAARDNDGVAYAHAQIDLARGQLERERLARRIGLNECSRPITSRAQLERDARPLLTAG